MNTDFVQSTIQGTGKGTEKDSNEQYCLLEPICLKGWNKTHTKNNISKA